MSTRKYTPEQLEAEIARPKRKAGRPRKYATEEEKKRAKADARMRVYWRKKNAESEIVGDNFALRKQIHRTDEERHTAKLRSASRYYAAHRAEVNLGKMVSYARCKARILI